MLYDHRFLALQIQPLDTSVDVICPLRQCSDCSNSGLCNRVFAKYYLYHNFIQFSLPITKTFHFHLAHLCSSPTIDIDIFFGDGPLNYHIFQYNISKQFMIIRMVAHCIHAAIFGFSFGANCCGIVPVKKVCFTKCQLCSVYCTNFVVGFLQRGHCVPWTLPLHYWYCLLGWTTGSKSLTFQCQQLHRIFIVFF